MAVCAAGGWDHNVAVCAAGCWDHGVAVCAAGFGIIMWQSLQQGLGS